MRVLAGTRRISGAPTNGYPLDTRRRSELARIEHWRGYSRIPGAGIRFPGASRRNPQSMRVLAGIQISALAVHMDTQSVPNGYPLSTHEYPSDTHLVLAVLAKKYGRST